MASGRQRRRARGSVGSAPDARTYRTRARRAIRQPAKSVGGGPLYVGPVRRHDRRAIRMVQAASAGVNIMQSGPAFYHPDFEPSSILLPQDQLEKNAWCFVPDTPVTMADGTRKRIEDVRPGDVVVSHLGRARRVVRKFRRDVAEDIVVLSVRGTSETIRCTANHEFKAVAAEDINCAHQKSSWAMCKPGSANNAATCEACVAKSRNPKPDWDGKIRAGELKRHDCLYEPVYSVENVPTELQNEKLLRFLGYYLAEGSASLKKAVVQIAMSREKDRDCIAEIEALCGGLFPKATVTRRDRPERGTIDLCIYSKRAAEVCLRHCGRYSHQKKLSQDIVDLPSRLLLPLLGAYSNGDGGQTTGSNAGILELTTVSIDLAHQLVFLLRKCGIPSSHYVQEIAKKIRVILLRSPLFNERIKLRYDVTCELLKQAGVQYEFVDSEGTSALSQMVSLVSLGDYASYYLAILYRVDPSPVKVISYLKDRLAQG